MKLLADENVDKPIVDRLRLEGHDVGYVLETAPGLSDKRVLDLSRRVNAVLLTTDKDFGEMVFRRKMTSHGVILLRLPEMNPYEKAEIVHKVLRDNGEGLDGVFTVITKKWVRLRRLL